jgi:DNA-binding response OmpR family regulator
MEILLVEDNTGDIILIQTTMEELAGVNLKFIIKTNGLEACNYVRFTGNVPQLIILDLNLPHRSGFDVLSEIKANMSLSNVPVIIFSSSTNPVDKQKSISMGAKAFFEKPMDFDEYKNKVESFLKYV